MPGMTETDSHIRGNGKYTRKEMIVTSSGISSSSAGYSIGTLQRNIKSFKENFQLLGQSLKSGDSGAARQAFSALQELLPASFGCRSQLGLQNVCHCTFTATFDVLGDALDAGDLSKACEAYSALQQDAKTPGAPRQTTEAALNEAVSSAKSGSGNMISLSA